MAERAKGAILAKFTPLRERAAVVAVETVKRAADAENNRKPPFFYFALRFL